MKEIELGGGYRALVDDEDFERLSTHQWAHNITRGKVYASRVYLRHRKRVRVFMHRELLGLEAGDRTQGDHENGNTLDNQRHNLRPATHGQNQHNRAIQRNNTSGYKGVWYVIANKKYRAGVKKNGKTHHAGTFLTALDAAIAYDAMAKDLFGDFARLNFPNSSKAA